MKTIVAGCREYHNKDFVWAELEKRKVDITQVLSGMALSWLWNTDPLIGGPDRYAFEWAKSVGVPAIPYHANWKKFGKQAGHMRNQDMAKDAQSVIAFWDGFSSGTGGMISLAKVYNLKLEVIRIAL